jgi:uncharacterized membrane protein (DUF373 family)
MNNILADIPAQLPAELSTSLLQNDKVHIQRIISIGESLLLRKLILGIQAQVRGKSLTGLIIICW